MPTTIGIARSSLSRALGPAIAPGTIKAARQAILELYLRLDAHVVVSQLMGGFDTLAAEVAIKAPNVSLLCLLPYPNQERFWNEERAEHFREIVDMSDGYRYVTSGQMPCYAHEVEKSLMIEQLRADATMASQSDAIAYLGHTREDAGQTWRFAHDEGKPTWRLDPQSLLRRSPVWVQEA